MKVNADSCKIKAAAVIAAGGSSSRMGGEDKLFADLGGIPVIIRAASAFEKASEVAEIIISAKPESAEKIRRLCAEHNFKKIKAIVNSGFNRHDSVQNAVREVSADTDVILIHDGARPFAEIGTEVGFISKIIKLASEKGAVIPAVRVKETVKTVKDGKISLTPGRDELYSAQTPQAFLFSRYLEAVKIFENIKSGGGSPLSPTDDAFLLERAGFDVFITEGDYRNIKITTPEDLKTARAIIETQIKDNANNAKFFENIIVGASLTRVGIGYDVHRLVKGRKLILCGVEIPNENEGLLGHSDADAAVHALMDALLGGLALGDIGFNFPDDDPQYKGISSMELLKKTVALISEKGYTPVNIDITIIAERPKLSPFIKQMRFNIAETCGIEFDRVSVKATTEEGLGLAGKGIGAYAVCTLAKYT